MKTFIELFAGVGGFRHGLESTRSFECLYSVDIDPLCKETYDLNFDPPSLLISDITHIDVSMIPSCDLITAGFPCQPFSIAGKRLGLDDPRGQLFFSLLNIIRDKKPPMILLENVKGLKNHESGRTLDSMLQSLNDLGYHTSSCILNTKQFALPQNRERLFILGSLEEAIDIHDLQSFRSDATPLDELLDPIDCIPHKYFYTPQSRIYSVLKDVVILNNYVYQYRRHYVRQHGYPGIVPTLTANMGTGGHNVPLLLQNQTIRKLTPTECFRLQGLPFRLPNIADSHLYKQAGNAVSSNVVYHIGRLLEL